MNTCVVFHISWPYNHISTFEILHHTILNTSVSFCFSIYIDITPNHMSANRSPCIGTGGSTCDAGVKDYPEVPYTATDFHATCPLEDFSDAYQVRFCELLGLRDLDQANDHVREMIVAFMDHLVDLGVAGFR